MLIVAVDANFRLKNLYRSSDQADRLPTLLLEGVEVADAVLVNVLEREE